MPIYEYVCMACGQEFEALQKFSDDPLTECTCGESGQVERKLSLSAFQLKGGGWYKDLYSAGGGKNGNGSNGNGKAASNGGSGKSDGAGTSSDSSSAKSDNTKSDSGKSAGSTTASA